VFSIYPQFCLRFSIYSEYPYLNKPILENLVYFCIIVAKIKRIIYSVDNISGKLKLSIFFLLITLFIFCPETKSQTERYVLGGTIADKETGEHLPGAEIYIHELVSGTVTDINGSFIFKNLIPARYHIHVKFIGYESYMEYINLDHDITDLVIELQPSSLELREVVIESDPFKTGPVEKSLSVQTVTANEIRKNSGGSLVNSLEKLPGINAINTGVGISKPVIRGLSFNRVLVAEQGIKQEGQQWGADHGLEIDQYRPEQVEIIKGPASLQYGSDGLGGIILINPPYLANLNSMDGEFLAMYKSNNHLIGTSTMIRGNNAGFVYQGRFSTQDYGDYQVPANNFIYNGFELPIKNNRLKNTAGRERNFSAMAGIKKDWGFSTMTLSNYNILAGFFPGAVGVPREYDLLDDRNNRNVDFPRQMVNHLKLISNSNILIGRNWLEMSLGYQHNDREEQGEPHAHGYQPTPDGNLALGLDLYTYSGNIRYNQVINDRINRVYGMQFQRQKNKYRGFEFLLPAFTGNDIGIFVHEQHELNDFASLNGGLRFDYGHRNILEHFEPDYSTEISSDSIMRNPAINKNFYNFSGAFGFSWFPNHNLNIKTNIGSSFRIPTAPELSMNGVHHGTFRHERGNPDLKSERGWQIDLNISYHIKNFNIDVTPYFNYYDHFIYLRPTSEFSTLPGGGQVFEYTQNQAIYTGAETSLDYHVTDIFQVEMNIEYVWNYNLDTRLPLPFTPPLSSNIELRYEQKNSFKWIENTFFAVGTKLVASQTRVDRNENVTDGYVLLYVGTGTRFIVAGQPLDVLVSVKNLLNTRYMNHLSRYRWLNLPEPGRNISISLTIPFTLLNRN
jgi:iron complex outermembrane receptor protein